MIVDYKLKYLYLLGIGEFLRINLSNFVIDNGGIFSLPGGYTFGSYFFVDFVSQSAFITIASGFLRIQLGSGLLNHTGISSFISHTIGDQVPDYAISLNSMVDADRNDPTAFIMLDSNTGELIQLDMSNTSNTIKNGPTIVATWISNSYVRNAFSFHPKLKLVFGYYYGNLFQATYAKNGEIICNDKVSLPDLNIDSIITLVVSPSSYLVFTYIDSSIDENFIQTFSLRKSLCLPEDVPFVKTNLSSSSLSSSLQVCSLCWPGTFHNNNFECELCPLGTYIIFI